MEAPALNGERVNVDLPFSQLDKYGRSIRAQIVAHAIASGVNAKAIGALDAISTLN